MTTKTSYQLAITCGFPIEAAATLAPSVKDATPGACDLESVKAVFEASGISAGDLRSQVVVIADGDRLSAIAAWAYLVGFASRHLDVITRKGVVAGEALWLGGGRQFDGGRPSTKPEEIFVGDVEDGIRIQQPSDLGKLSRQDISTIRFARKIRFVPGPDLFDSLALVMAISGIRARGNTERMPSVAVGPDEYLSLEELRQAGFEARRAEMAAVEHPRLPAEALTARQQRLNSAAERDIHEVLGLLGVHEHESLYHCPRPERHTHGDATASMRVSEGRVRCGRCDGEWIDALRLTMDCLRRSPDEAADLLLGDDSAWPIVDGASRPCDQAAH